MLVMQENMIDLIIPKALLIMKALKNTDFKEITL